MKKDIQRREVLDIGVAVIPEKNGEHGTIWDVYLVNLKEEPIKNVIINVVGQGELDGKERATSNIRYYHPEVAALSYAHIEVMIPQVAALSNRYWISFEHDNYMFDKKYEVPWDTTCESPDFLIPVIGRVGYWFE